MIHSHPLRTPCPKIQAAPVLHLDDLEGVEIHLAETLLFDGRKETPRGTPHPHAGRPVLGLIDADFCYGSINGNLSSRSTKYKFF